MMGSSRGGNLMLIGQTNRRSFIAGLAGATIVGTRSAVAQAPSKVYRLAGANPGGVMDDNNLYLKLLLPSLKQRGYTRGQNLELEAPRPGSSLPEVFQR